MRALIFTFILVVIPIMNAGCFQADVNFNHNIRLLEVPNPFRDPDIKTIIPGWMMPNTIKVEQIHLPVHMETFTFLGAIMEVSTPSGIEFYHWGAYNTAYDDLSVAQKAHETILGPEITKTIDWFVVDPQELSQHNMKFDDLTNNSNWLRR